MNLSPPTENTWSRCAYYNNNHTKDEVLAWFDRTIARLRAERGMNELRDLVRVPVATETPETVAA